MKNIKFWFVAVMLVFSVGIYIQSDIVNAEDMAEPAPVVEAVTLEEVVEEVEILDFEVTSEEDDVVVEETAVSTTTIATTTNTNTDTVIKVLKLTVDDEDVSDEESDTDIEFPKLYTDKPEYEPGETVTLSGKFFSALSNIVVRVFGNSEVGNHFSDVALNVSVDEDGEFSLSHILDNFYRPIYNVVASTETGEEIATMTFLDGPNASGDLDQCGNGTFASPVPCTGAAWQNGNLNSNQAHYTEGDSVPYRIVLSDVPTTGTSTLVIEYDVKNSGKNAIDFLTSFDRTETTANPCSGVSPCAPGTEVAIPTPNGATTTAVFNSLSAGDKMFSIYNGTITSITYPVQGNLALTNSATQVQINFTSTNGTVVIAWAGHIATTADWGVGNAAGGISGSPYHMRLKEINGKSGNQDRSLSAGAIVGPGAEQPGHIVVVKDAVPNNAQDFSFTGSGIIGAFSLDDDSNATLSNTRVFEVPAGTYSITEDATAGWKQGSATCTGGSTPGSINVLAGATTTCTFVNNKLATITLIKNTVGGNGTFDFNMTGTSLPASAQLVTSNGSASTTFTNIDPDNTYSIAEVVPTGWDLASTTCENVTSAGGVSSRNASSFTTTNGGAITCTFTNVKKPTLTVTKIVVNDDGGTKEVSDFPLFVDGDSVTSGEANVLNAGSYTVSETSLAGYTGTIGGDCAGDGTVTLASGDNKTCTITNDDQPGTLIVNKIVINDNGGTAVASDFSFSVDGATSTNFELDGENALTVDAGTYDVTESAVTGYEATYDNCADVSVANGATSTCTITNNDIAPKLTVTKVVINDNGGTKEVSDFPLSVGTTTVTSGVESNFNTGSYVVSEVADSGYTSTISGDCDADGNVTLGLADVKSCTITNDDKPGHLIVSKITNPASDTTTVFSITANGGTVLGSSTQSIVGGASVDYTVNAGTYDVDEADLSGWEETSNTCADVVVANGATSTCTITNTKLAKLTVVKDATPGDLQDFSFNGGVLGAFSLDDDLGVVGEDSVLSNSKTFENLAVGTNYTVVENLPNSFWTFDGAGCVKTGTTDAFASTATTTGLTVSLGAGDDVTCTFLNSKESPTRTQGFWQTHTSYTSSVFASIIGGMPIGTAPHKGVITTAGQVFGAYWSNIAKTTNNKQRTAIDKARMQLLQQLVTAKLNCKAFGCSVTIQTLIANADIAYAGNSEATIKSYIGLLDAYNNSGDTMVIGNAGKATPKDSQNLADKAFWNLP